MKFDIIHMSGYTHTEALPMPQHNHTGALPIPEHNHTWALLPMPEHYPYRGTTQARASQCQSIPMSELIDKNDKANEKCYFKLLLLITFMLLKTN